MKVMNLNHAKEILLKSIQDGALCGDEIEALETFIEYFESVSHVIDDFKSGKYKIIQDNQELPFGSDHIETCCKQCSYFNIKYDHEYQDPYCSLFKCRLNTPNRPDFPCVRFLSIKCCDTCKYCGGGYDGWGSYLTCTKRGVALNKSKSYHNSCGSYERKNL